MVETRYIVWDTQRKEVSGKVYSKAGNAKGSITKDYFIACGINSLKEDNLRTLEDFIDRLINRESYLKTLKKDSKTCQTFLDKSKEIYETVTSGKSSYANARFKIPYSDQTRFEIYALTINVDPVTGKPKMVVSEDPLT